MSSTNNQNVEDEIDLGILLLKIVKSISKYKLVISISAIVGIGLGIGVYYYQTPKYESDMIIESSILTEAYSNTLTETLERLIAEENDRVLSEKLALSLEQAAHLRAISVESIAEDENSDDATKNRIFKIHVETTDNDLLKDLEKGIISFLENNEYVKKRISLKKARLENLIDKFNREIKEIDSLKSKINENIARPASGANNLLVLDPTTAYSAALDLYKEEIYHQQALELINSIHLIEGFVAFKKPASPKLTLSTFIGFMIGLFFAFGVIVVAELRTYLKKLNQEISANS